jgi:peptidoglycan/LPS O-acetylase OafA/YrhL
MRVLALVLMAIGGGFLSWLLVFAGAFGAPPYLVAGVVAGLLTILALRRPWPAPVGLGLAGVVDCLIFGPVALTGASHTDRLVGLTYALPGAVAVIGVLVIWYVHDKRLQRPPTEIDGSPPAQS